MSPDPDHEPPPRYFRPVIMPAEHLGAIGGPRGYMEVATLDEAREGPVIVDEESKPGESQ